MQKEEYRQMYKEVYPLVEEIIRVSESYRITEGVSLVTDQEGYINLEVKENGEYRMVRVGRNEPVELRANYPLEPKIEPLFEEELHEKNTGHAETV